MQARVSHEAPVLIRIETRSGHGASSTAKYLESNADVYAFLMHNLGAQPSFAKQVIQDTHSR
jgi:prolyl oligopeptidase